MKIPYTIIRKSEYQQLILDKQMLEKNISDATGFIKSIELGELDSTIFSESQNNSSLSGALLSMRNQMKVIEEKERERNWATEGLAKFVEILRSNNDNIDTLYNNIISNLVKYLNANQGGLFVINDDDEQEPVIELVACYAYNRKKYLEKKLAFGEGLVGQCVLEKDKIHMTEIPKDYVSITSGLGDATPASLIIIPLKVNENVYGVVEIASFKPFLPHQIEFIERLGESIASTISNAKVGFKTQRLLKESQMKEEQLRSQEEEMRQNMEELSATQEEMQRVLKDVQGKEVYLNELLNVSLDSIFTLDSHYKLISWNKAFSTDLEAMGLKIEKGFEILQLFQDDKDRKKNIAYYDRVFRGEAFELTDRIEMNNEVSYYRVSYAPIRSEKGEVVAAAVFAKNVTEEVVAKEKSDTLLKETQQQTEELRSQEEEMRQNMEELSATQEEIQRVLEDAQAKETYLSELLNASTDSIFTLDKDYRVISFNKTFSRLFEAMGLKMEKGFDILQIFEEKDKAKHVSYYKRVLSGETFEVTDKSEVNDQSSYYVISYVPLKDQNGNVTAAAVFAKDMTEMMQAKDKTEVLLKDAQMQTEELRAQEEEMKQNLEELQAIQEELARKNSEVEEVRAKEKARADQQIDAQKTVMLKTVEKFRNSESLLMSKIESLEKELATLKETRNKKAA